MSDHYQFPVRIDGALGTIAPQLVPPVAPTAHASTHAPGGSDPLAVDAVAGTGSLRTLGTGAQQACPGNDGRLSDARAPTSHASTHAAAGSDAVTVVESQISLADNTTGNVSSSKHGFVPKAPNDASKYLDGTGTWSNPPSGGGSLSTIYSVDFTALAAQNLLTGGDGAKTINGKTWNLVNSANLATAYINDGMHAGLYLRCNTNNSNNYDTTLSGGVLWTRAPSLASGLAAQNWGTMWVMYMFSTPHTPNADFEAVHFDLFWGTNYAIASMARVDANLSYNTGQGGKTFVPSLTPPNTTTSYGVGDSTHTSYDVVALKVVSNTVGIYIGQSSGGAFPSVSSLVLLGTATVSSTTVLQMLSYEWGLAFSVRSGNSAGAADLLLKKLQVLTS
jgi:hypothetical protein